jgi:hypothetical protein
VCRNYILFILVLACLPSLAQESKVFKGYVLTIDNIPISDVHIYISNSSKLICISNIDGSFEMSTSVLEANTVIHFKHISYVELSLSYNEIIQAKGIIQMKESVRFLDQITVHPLTAKQMFLTAIENMRNVSIDYTLFAIHTTWKANAIDNDSIRTQSLLDSLSSNILQIPFLDTINTVVYFDYIRSQAAVFNIANQDDYSYEYVSSEGLEPMFTLIKCSNRSVRGNELLITVSNDDFRILRVGFRYVWSTAPHIWTTDLRYRISTLSGESAYDLKSKKLISIDAKAVILIGTYDSINQKFKPMISAEKEYCASQL